MRASSVAVMLVVACAASTVCAQTDSVRPGSRAGDVSAVALFDTTMRTASFGLNRTVNTFLWTINSGLAGSTLGGKYMLTERMSASMVPEIGDAAAERTDLDVRLGLFYPMVQSWGFAAHSAWQSIADNRNIGINNVTRVGAMGGVQGNAWDDLRVAGFAGGISDRQIGMLNTGPQYLAELRLAPVIASEYTVWGRASSAQEFITPRRNTTQGGEVNADLRGQGSDIRAHVDVIHNERDFYFADSASMPYTGQANNIEQRIESGLHAGVQGEYGSADAMRVHFEGDVSNRTVTRHDAYKTFALPGAHIDTRVEEFRLTGAASVLGDLFGASAAANIRYEQYQETHGVVGAPENTAITLQQQAAVESQKNGVSRRTQLSGALGIPAGGDDTVALNASFGIMHYDTPDTNNTDDRDELDMVFHAAYSTRPFPGCTWGVRGDLFLHHLVYLFSAQSGNNAWNRIIRLSPFIAITPARNVRTMASFDVLGNYTVFDFEPLLQSLHSYSFRQLELRDSSQWSITPAIMLTGYVDTRWYEHGQLDYAAFRERPIDRVQEWSYGATLTRELMAGFRVGCGVRAFTRYVATYAGAGVYTPSVDLRAFGPTAVVVWNVPQWGVLGVDGWYEVIREGTQDARSIPNILMTVQWTL